MVQPPGCFPTMFAGFGNLYMALNRLLELGLRDFLLNYYISGFKLLLQIHHCFFLDKGS